MHKRRANVLLVEDSPADQVIVKRALEDGRVDCNLKITEHGEQALRYLRNQPPYEDKHTYPSPDLILLDINMPIMDGRETLENIRNDEQLKHYPIIMLTTSSNDKDVIQSYRLGVNAFVTKPLDEQDFMKAVMQMEQFWFELVTLPAI